MKKRLLTCLILCALGSSATFAQPVPVPDPAAVDAEREALARIQYELLLIHQEVKDAEKSAPRASRVRFRYDWLANDLEMIERAIQDHFDAPRQPRAIPPLKGDYRH